MDLKYTTNEKLLSFVMWSFEPTTVLSDQVIAASRGGIPLSIDLEQSVTYCM